MRPVVWLGMAEFLFAGGVAARASFSQLTLAHIAAHPIRRARRYVANRLSCASTGCVTLLTGWEGLMMEIPASL